MDRQAVLANLDPSLLRFAQRLRDELRAERVLLFGSHARGTAYHDSDYDLMIVSEHFRTIPRMQRQVGLRPRFYQVGGHAPMDLICMTPDEFDAAAERPGFVSAVLPEAIDLLEATAATA